MNDKQLNSIIQKAKKIADFAELYNVVKQEYSFQTADLEVYGVLFQDFKFIAIDSNIKNESFLVTTIYHEMHHVFQDHYSRYKKGKSRKNAWIDYYQNEFDTIKAEKTFLQNNKKQLQSLFGKHKELFPKELETTQNKLKYIKSNRFKGL